MSESDGVQQAKRKLSQVTLTQDAGNGDDDERRPIVVGHHVREDVAEKSGLLAGLPHAGGLASLPDDISPEDVQLWQASKVVNTAPSTDELVTILKVRSHCRWHWYMAAIARKCNTIGAPLHTIISNR